MSTVETHIHEYERSKSNKEIYRCLDPACSHFTRRELIVGKYVRCSKCKEVTIARQDQLRSGQSRNGVKTLTCLECSRSPKGKDVVAVRSMIEEMFKKDVG